MGAMSGPPSSCRGPPFLSPPWHDHRLRAASGGSVGECLRDAREREARRDEPADAEFGHQRERAAERGAPAERAGDPDPAEVHVPEAERELAALGADTDELHDPA